MTEEDEKIIEDFVTLAMVSWNPENFTDLLGLLELEAPELAIKGTLS